MHARKWRLAKIDSQIINCPKISCYTVCVIITYNYNYIDFIIIESLHFLRIRIWEPGEAFLTQRMSLYCLLWLYWLNSNVGKLQLQLHNLIHDMYYTTCSWFSTYWWSSARWMQICKINNSVVDTMMLLASMFNYLVVIVGSLVIELASD